MLGFTLARAVVMLLTGTRNRGYSVKFTGEQQVEPVSPVAVDVVDTKGFVQSYSNQRV